MEVRESIEIYLAQLRADGRSEHTVRQAARHTRSFADWLALEDRAGGVEDVSIRDVAAFFASPAATTRPDGLPKAPASTNALRSSIRSWFRFLHDSQIVSSNPARLLKRARCTPAAPRAMSEKEAQHLLSVLANTRGQAARRDEALVRLMLFAGVRIGAAIALDVRDVDFARQEVFLRRDKNSHSHTVVLSSALAKHLRKYVGELRTGPLFPRADGGRISVRHAQRRFAAAVRAAGIARSVSPHCLRHSFAMSLLKASGNLAVVQRALGHASISSTVVYAAADDRAVRTAIETARGQQAMSS